MRRLAVFVAAAKLALAALSAEAAATGSRYGVAAGDVTATSAVLWTRAPSSGLLEWEFPEVGGLPVRGQLQALPRKDLTAQLSLRGLRPGARYVFRFRQGRDVSELGRFTTAPPASLNVPIRFAISGDADATRATNGKPAFNTFGVYARMAAERNDFNINLGDTIYADSEVANAPVARTRVQKGAKYKLGLALPALRKLRASAALYSHWDDHEFVNDFSRPEHGDAIYRAGVHAFRDYSPVTYFPATGLYRTFRWGKHLELFFLDERSFRSAKVTQACGADLAPTAPQAARNAFATLAPALRNPVPPACIAAIEDPARTMLGVSQRVELRRAIRSSTATWKVIVNEVPIQQYYALPYDRWEGYAAEREQL